MIKITRYFTKLEWFLTFLVIVLVTCQVGLDLAIPDYMTKITQSLQMSDTMMADIYKYGSAMILLAILSLVASSLTALCATKIATQFSSKLRELLFEKVESFSLVELGKFSVASLITRSTNDVMQIQKIIVIGLQVFVKAPIMATWAIAKIYNKHIAWTTATAATVAALAVIVIVLVAVCTPKFRLIQSLTDNLNRVLRENLTGLRVVRAYNAESYQEDKFENANEEITKTYLFTSRSMAFLFPTVQFAMNSLMVSVYLIGASLINSAETFNARAVYFSDMIVLTQYAIQVVMAFMFLVMIFIMLPRATVAANRILEVLDTEPSITDGEIVDPATNLCGHVEFKNVSFQYEGAAQPVLQDISFTATQGQTVAIVGTTGSGKSTIINMIPRFFDVTQGEVLVDGVNVKDYKQSALREKISYISQKAVLFSGDIKSNILYGQESQSNDSSVLSNAIGIAQSSKFIEDLEDGVNSRVAQGGTNFSGGQKQRISIARGIAKESEILIFDDSFSALDYKTDAKLRKALDEKCSDVTRFIVAQRIGTIRDADLILVIKDGRMVGQGTHDELMRSCEEYAEIALSQLSAKELA